GDLHNLPAYDAFRQAVDHLESVLAVAPKLVACDMHPDYLSTRYARERGLPCIEVQHHHAHIASVLAEAGRRDRVIGVAFDGMGWGDDGGLWGGEFLACDLRASTRMAHIEPVPQPGGDAAAKRPPRMAYAYLRAAFGADADAIAQERLPAFAATELTVVAQLLHRGVNCPPTSGMGRLFDAASALLGICDCNTYHAQAPMELEACAADALDEAGHYPARLRDSGPGPIVAVASDIVRHLVEDSGSGTPAATCAARFHNSVAHLTLDICRRIRDNTRLQAVALSGGVFANAFLVERLVPLLEQDGFEVLLNTAVPPGDGGISLGQAAIAAARAQ
ncbi:MAG: carbamoyltransferase HypF, partial [Candidatus Hydrogenedentes bacterium]|nr:carbamoyltransferase HypF [Candidatus Hydrogenedentota bacterium]